MSKTYEKVVKTNLTISGTVLVESVKFIEEVDDEIL